MSTLANIRGYFFDTLGNHKANILRHPLFWFGLGVKILPAAVFPGLYLASDFIPFAQIFINGSNPYIAAGPTLEFPYPSAMLYILAAPLMLAQYFPVATLFLAKLPLLLADVLILLILARWVRNRDTILLLAYWCSPILIYITYIHGQLDVLPIALALLGIHLLTRHRYLLAAVVFGIAIATKVHIVAIIPLIFLYAWRNHLPLTNLVRYAAVGLSTVIILSLPFAFSSHYYQVILFASEQRKVLDMVLTIGAHTLYIIPLAYGALLIRAYHFRHQNRDTLCMLIGFTFGTLLIFIPPSPGWYYWVIPFFALLAAKTERNWWLYVSALIFAYALYFSAPYYPISEIFGVALRDLAFTLLTGTLLIHLVWLYRYGVTASADRLFFNTPYTVGIAGDSGSGKTTLAKQLADVLVAHESTILCGDGLHKWERGASEWQTITHLDPRANALHDDIVHLNNLKKGVPTYRRLYDHDTGRFTNPQKFRSARLIILEGLHSFTVPSVRSALNLMIYLKPHESIRTQWKVNRDSAKRGKSVEDVKKELAIRQPDAEKYIHPQAQHAQIIFGLEEDGLVVELTPDVSYDRLITALSPNTDLTHEYAKTKQILRFRHPLTPEELEAITRSLLPVLYTDHQPHIHQGWSGIMQLIVFYHILESIAYGEKRELS